LNKTDGSLECGPIKFFPKITGRFSKAGDAYLFLQTFYPRGGSIESNFQLTGKDGSSARIEASKVAESWDKDSHVWSQTFKLNLENTPPGDYVLRIDVLAPAGSPPLTKELKMIIF